MGEKTSERAVSYEDLARVSGSLRLWRETAAEGRPGFLRHLAGSCVFESTVYEAAEQLRVPRAEALEVARNELTAVWTAAVNSASAVPSRQHEGPAVPAESETTDGTQSEGARPLDS